jgi:adenylosuccinate lyase
MGINKSISPLDGRYGERLAHLGEFFSEFALMRMRVKVELRFLLALNKTGLFPALKATELNAIARQENEFAESDFTRIKEIETGINHDVKACEVFLREKLGLTNPNMIHFGLTSEDINNLAYTLLLKAYVEEQQLPQLRELLTVLLEHCRNWKAVAFPARTHGQMASPTTAGKEMAVVLSRLLKLYKRLSDFKFCAKLNGATGNYSALLAAFPNYDWLAFSEQFMQENGSEANLVTTQIEDHDNWAEYFSIVRQINHVALDLDRDIWLYLTLGYLVISADKGAVGSSTMPHKVNPINFENSEGNLHLSTAMLNGLTDKFGQSRLQRDLSDSTVERNIGVALSHSWLAVSETIRGLKKLAVNEARCTEELEAHPELLAEPIQTILRREGVDDPYSLLKEITRGKRVSRDELAALADRLDIRPEVRDELKKLDAATYIGAAERICRIVIDQAEKILHLSRETKKNKQNRG